MNVNVRTFDSRRECLGTLATCFEIVARLTIFTTTTAYLVSSAGRWTQPVASSTGRDSHQAPWHVPTVAITPLSRKHPRPSPQNALPEGDGVAPFLSVRTAFDLYLKALRLPRGSRVVCSPLTIPDMVTILEEHGLVLMPVDLDPITLAPEPGAMESELERIRADSQAAGAGGNGSVRAIYVAHVFGAQVRRVAPYGGAWPSLSAVCCFFHQFDASVWKSRPLSLPRAAFHRPLRIDESVIL